MAKINLTKFAVTKSITVSPAYMYSLLDNGDIEPIKVNTVTVLGNQTQDGAKEDSVKNANIQRIDTAFLNKDSSTLVLKFSVKITSFRIEMISDLQFAKKLTEMHQKYDYSTLAKLYAKQFINGSFLWRNKFGSNLTVKIETLFNNQVNTFEFDDEKQDLDNFADLIKKALSGEGFLEINVTASIRLGHGQEVFPSQEFVESTDSNKKSKTLYSNYDNHAMIHSQKIGNALRQIDIWHSGFNELGAIAVEPFGNVPRFEVAYRYNNKTSFYDILKNVHTESSISEDEKHFFFAVLVRGGVFNVK